MKKIIHAIGLTLCLMTLSQLTRAQYILKEADDQYNLYNYSEAVKLYLKAYKKKPTLYTAEHIAGCYTAMRDYIKSEAWYGTIIDMEDRKPIDVYKYAVALQNNSKYAAAKVQYTKYYTISPETDKPKLKFYITSCDSAVKWMKAPNPVDITNEQKLNTRKSDWGAVTNGDLLVFASDRQNKTAEESAKKTRPFLKFDGSKVPDPDIYGWTGNNYLRLYQYDKVNKADTITLFPFSAGTEYHVGPVSFTKDGSEMYFNLTRVPKDWAAGKGNIKTINIEIYSSKKNVSSGKWDKPVPFKYNSVEKYSVGDPFISGDGQTLYFVSNMPGGSGGTDIYKCTKNDAGDWSDPVNVKALNTPGNERTPVIDSASNIYFSSDWGIGMGGLDIFKAVHTADSFGPRQNLGYPVNSPLDDFAYLPVGITTGYFSSNRVGGVGSDDIYSYLLKPIDVYRLTGVVFEKGTILVIPNSVVRLNAPNNREVIARTDNSGRYNFVLQGKTDYKIKAEQTGYLADNQTASTVGLAGSQTIKKDLFLDKITLNKAIKIENIYYDYDKSNIRPDAAIELDKLVTILKDNPTIYIELGSHTDSRGNDDYNMALSQRRANSAVAYIIKVGGIDPARIVARGYGETRLLNRCENGVKCSEAEHQLNRRTEFKITQY